ncbi:hypothetical protein PIB30_044583 [Stylosanthes scabra]|uniref:Uncharacterized protein n=1 Tax=Stylosanthes scabra TaxID=79078 RepID=A0ABU6YGK9_9FABA|nr:hypothetical protein [Stylosanthes scabra]
MEKQSCFDHLMQKMAEVEGMGPCSVLPHARAPASPSGASASTSAAPVPPTPSSGAAKTGKMPPVASSGKPFSMEREEGVKEDPSADLKQKKRKWKEHEVNPIDRAFPMDYNFRAALDAGLSQGAIREILGPLVGVENAFAAKKKKWKSLAEETGEMVHETFQILMDQVRHLNPAIDYSMITLDTRWNPKAKMIYNPKAEAQKQSELAAEDQSEPVAEVQPEVDGQLEPVVEQQWRKPR